MRTLRRFSFFFFLLLTINVVNAQDYLILKGGGTFNYFRGNNIWPPTAYEQTLTSTQLEIGMCDSSNKYFYPEVSLIFHGKGFHGTMGTYSKTEDYTYYGKFNLNYLTLNFQPNFCFGEDVKYFVAPGFFAGVLLSAKLDGTYQSSSILGSNMITKAYNGSIRKEFQTLDIGLSIKNGIKYKVSKFCQVSAEIGYYQSFNANKYGMKNASVAVGAGVYLSLDHPKLNFLKCKSKQDTNAVQSTVTPASATPVATPATNTNPSEATPTAPSEQPSQWTPADPNATTTPNNQQTTTPTPSTPDSAVPPIEPTTPAEPSQWVPADPNPQQPKATETNQPK